MDRNIKKIKGDAALMMRSNWSRILLFYACSFIFILFDYSAHAENLPDPTRPPSEFEPVAAVGATASSGPMLQSVLISPSYKAAIINGETVTLGGMYGSSRVVKISESGVVLNEGGNLQTLKLFPGVEKKMLQIDGTNDSTAKKLPHSKRSAVKKEEQ
jgi:MSHA biogenesis protein MshK